MAPVAPMLAKLARALPEDDDLVYEPKWDGFRCIVFRDGDEVELGSRNERPLTRYFPELMEPLRAPLPDRAVVDGEIVIAGTRGLDFDALLQRIHPAASRVDLLAETTPASFVAFDLLALDDRDLRAAPSPNAGRCSRRRWPAQAPCPSHPRHHRSGRGPGLVRPLRGRRPRRGRGQAAGPPLPRGRAAHDQGEARAHRRLRGGRLPLAQVRAHRRVAAARSLRRRRRPAHVGVTASFTMARRRELVDELAPYRRTSLAGHPWEAWAAAEPAGGRTPGAPIALERQEGPELGAAVTRARLRGGLRQSPGRPLPPRHHLPALAP